MPDTASAALLFLVNTIFDLYLFVLMIRIILSYTGVNYFDPAAQFIIKLTNPVIKPLRRIIPNVKRIEVSTILLIFILEIIKFILIISIGAHFPNLLGVIIMSFGDILKILFDTFFYAILLQVILSWLQPGSPANRLLIQFTAPVLQPFQRLIPPISGFDISPIFALILLQLLNILIVNPLLMIGMRVALGK